MFVHSFIWAAHIFSPEKFAENTQMKEVMGMEEKVIIESKSLWVKRKKFVVLFLVVSVAICVLSLVAFAIIDSQAEALSKEPVVIYNPEIDAYIDTGNGEKYQALLNTEKIALTIGVVSRYSIVPLSFILLIVYLYASKMQITVTDKRVYGKAAFGKRVDLPLDSISVVASGAFQGLTVATSAGKIKFKWMERRDEVLHEISELLIGRQRKQAEGDASKVEIKNFSAADELVKYKDLLDKGIITQEEFDAKKKQLLGL